MHASTMILIDYYGTFTVQLPSVAMVKLKPNDDNVIVMLDSDDDVCHVVDFSDTSYFPCRTRTPTPILIFVDIVKTAYNPL